MIARIAKNPRTWFGLAGMAFVAGLFVVRGTAQAIVLLFALFAFLGACVGALVVAVRDDDVSCASFGSPVARTMAMIGSDGGYARRRRRLERERRIDASR